MRDGVEGFLKIKYLEISLEAMVKILGKVFNSDNQLGFTNVFWSETMLEVR